MTKIVKCRHCEETFSRNCDLEKHMDEHENGKGFKCNTCEKTFHLKWRLNKHEKNHNENGVKIAVTSLTKNPVLSFACPIRNL